MSSDVKGKPTAASPKTPSTGGVTARLAGQTGKKSPTASAKVINMEFQMAFCEAMKRGPIVSTTQQSHRQHSQGTSGTKAPGLRLNAPGPDKPMINTQTLEDIPDKLSDVHVNDDKSPTAFTEAYTHSENLLQGETKRLKREANRR